MGKEGENGGICNSVNNESKEKIYIKEKERGEKGIWNMEQYPGVEKKNADFGNQMSCISTLLLPQALSKTLNFSEL